MDPSILVTMARAPVLYVHGNHDQSYERRPPEGCDCIEDKLVTINGVRILGLGGCPVYSGGPHVQKRKKTFKPPVGVVLAVAVALGGGMGDHDVHPFGPPDAEAQLPYPPDHLILRVLVGPAAVDGTPPQAKDAHAVDGCARA